MTSQVVMSELDPRLAYIQVTHLTPHWDDVDLDARPTEFEHNNNIKQVRGCPSRLPSTSCSVFIVTVSSWLWWSGS